MQVVKRPWVHSLFNGILKECYCIILGILCKDVLLPCYFVVVFVVVFGHLPWEKTKQRQNFNLDYLKNIG